MPAPFPVALDYAHTGAMVAPSDRDLAEAGAVIVGVERRQSLRTKYLDRAFTEIAVFFVVNTVMIGVTAGAALLGWADPEGAVTFAVALLAVLAATILARLALAPAAGATEMFTPDELARLIGYVTCDIEDGPGLTPLGHRAREAYAAWPSPLDPPVTVEEAAWKPLR